MSSRLKWDLRVKIWKLALLQKEPPERIRKQFPVDSKAGKVHSWATIDGVIKEFVLLSPAQVQQLSEPLQARWRELQPEEVAQRPEVPRLRNAKRRGRRSEPQGSDQTGLRELIADCWKEVSSYYPTDLLWNWIGHSDELLSTGTYHGDVVALVRSQIEGRRAGRSLLAPYLQAEHHPKFRLLIGTQKTPDLSEALDAWRRRITTYIQAFHRMLEKTEPLSAHVFDALAAEASSQSLAGPPWLDSTRPDGVVIKAVLERLVIAFVNCELLTTSVAELPAHPNWTQLTNRLEVLRLRINLQLVELIGFVPSGGWQRRITDSQVLLQDGPLGVTREFLDELRSLRPTEGQILRLLGELGGEVTSGLNDIGDTHRDAVRG